MMYLQTDRGLISESAVRLIESEQHRGSEHFNTVHYEIGGEGFTARADAGDVDIFLELDAETCYRRMEARQ